jgi:Cu/Ag efflux protein CusF
MGVREKRVDMPRTNTPVWLTLAATIFVAAHASALETLPGEPPVEEKHQGIEERTAPSDEPLARGRVVAVDRDAGRITLEYRPIPAFFLDGGTRIFHVGDPASLTGLGPGDKVRFEVERDGRSYTIVRLVNSN